MAALNFRNIASKLTAGVLAAYVGFAPAAKAAGPQVPGHQTEHQFSKDHLTDALINSSLTASLLQQFKGASATQTGILNLGDGVFGSLVTAGSVQIDRGTRGNQRLSNSIEGGVQQSGVGFSNVQFLHGLGPQVIRNTISGTVKNSSIVFDNSQTATEPGFKANGPKSPNFDGPK